VDPTRYRESHLLGFLLCEPCLELYQLCKKNHWILQVLWEVKAKGQKVRGRKETEVGKSTEREEEREEEERERARKPIIFRRFLFSATLSLNEMLSDLLQVIL
jgi:hypothetical protein